MDPFTFIVMMALPVVFIGILIYIRDKFLDYIVGPILDTITSWFNFKNYRQQENFEMILFFIIGIGFIIGFIKLLLFILI